ncbi:hypothetical protein [Streptomyces venezuelae]|uniref:hypothetical protein n=1 Tax=Streptomyces venezuelae TaxID=54571 RepID=UPI001CC245BE|nr:hypothetical protein [Streptomyces venezuelae]
MAHDGTRPTHTSAAGIDGRPAEQTARGNLGETLGAFRRQPRAVHGFTLRVSALTVVLGCAVLAGGFAAAWDTFEGVRQYADRNIANEDSYVAYADGATPELAKVAFVMMPALLVLALLVLSVLHAAHAVGASHAAHDGGPLSAREVWQRTRRRLPAALAVNALTGLAVGTVVVAALMLWAFVESGGVPGVERTPIGETAAPQYTLVGWVLPIAVGCLGPLLYSRLALATAETVLARRSPFAALHRSWVLTRRARLRTLGVGAAVTAAAFLFLWLAPYAAAPLVHYAGLGMLRLSDDNVWITGVLMKVLPTAVALLLLPPLVMPVVCSAFARLREDLGSAAAQRGNVPTGAYEGS